MSKNKKLPFDYSIKGFTAIPIDLLDLASWNYKQEDKRKSKRLVGNFLRNGQIENVIVRQDKKRFEMTNGNHRLETARTIVQLFQENGIEKFLQDNRIVPKSVVELIDVEESNRPPVYMNEDGSISINEENHLLKGELYCFNLGEVSEVEGKRIAIETNETKFESDAMSLAKLMESLSDEYGIEQLTGTMPFTETELSGFQDLSKFDWNQYEDPPGKSEENQESEHKEDQDGTSSDPDRTSIEIIITVLRNDEDDVRAIIDKQIVQKYEDVTVD